MRTGRREAPALTRLEWVIRSSWTNGAHLRLTRRVLGVFRQFSSCEFSLLPTSVHAPPQRHAYSTSTILYEDFVANATRYSDQIRIIAELDLGLNTLGRRFESPQVGPQNWLLVGGAYQPNLSQTVNLRRIGHCESLPEQSVYYVQPRAPLRAVGRGSFP